MNLNDALEAYLAYLRDLGKSEMTLYTYGKDAGQKWPSLAISPLRTYPA